jgi:hypothetical protein
MPSAFHRVLRRVPQRMPFTKKISTASIEDASVSLTYKHSRSRVLPPRNTAKPLRERSALRFLTLFWACPSPEKIWRLGVVPVTIGIRHSLFFVRTSFVRFVISASKYIIFLGAFSRFSLQACLSFAMFVGLRGLPVVASSPNKHNANYYAGLFATIAGAASR